MGGLVHNFRELVPTLADHLEEYHGVMMPHLLMGEVILWMTEHRSQKALCRSIWAWLERAFVEGSDEERNVIALSAVEYIPPKGQPGSEWRKMLGRSLASYDRAWNPDNY
jgi:hypothetical protein